MRLVTQKEDFVDLERQMSEKKWPWLSTPNGLTFARAAGGLVLGVLMATGNVEPKTAAVTAAALVLSDAEGTAINLGKKLPEKARDFLRLWPSKVGRLADPIADKIFVVPALIGGIIGGYLPAETLAIIGTEAATSAATFYTGKKINRAPDVSTVGKLGIIARFGTIGTFLAANATSNERVSDILTNTGHVATAAAVALGTLSCIDIYRQSRQNLIPTEAEA